MRPGEHIGRRELLLLQQPLQAVAPLRLDRTLLESG